MVKMNRITKLGYYFLFFLLLYFNFCKSRAKATEAHFAPIFLPEQCHISTTDDANDNHKPPTCNFGLSVDPSAINISCFENGTLRIVGDYEALSINCTASYPLDFTFDGTLPTEAINVTLKRTVQPNTNRQNISYHMDLVIRSVPALFSTLNNTSRKQLTYSNDADYSRTGNYRFSGYNDFSNLSTSFYIFFEEPSVSPNFIRNKDILVNREGMNVTVPCRTTHITSNVTLYVDGNKREAPYSPETGFQLIINDSTVFTEPPHCLLTDGETSEKIIIPERPSRTVRPPPPPGDRGPRNTPTITSNLQPISFGSYGTKISCRLENLDSFLGTATLTAIGAANAPMHKLIRDFTLPDYVNRSYSVLIGKQENDFKDHLKITKLIKEHVISAVCGNESVSSAMSFGTTLSCEIFPFIFDQEWSSLERDQSNADRYFLLGNDSSSQKFYENQAVEFKCRISTFIMSAPSIWYVRYKNGTLVEALIDDNWNDGMTYFLTNVTMDMVEVACAASIWHKDEWWNMTTPIEVQPSTEPSFNEDECASLETSFTVKSVGVIRCSAFGIPPPTVWWTRKGEPITKGTVNESIYEFRKVAWSDGGEYTCFARNSKGHDMRSIQVQIESGNATSSVIIGVSSAAIVGTIAALYIYYVFFNKKKGGLSKAEIKEFMEGRDDANYQDLEGASGVYKALTGFVPYNRKFEISQSRFQIDKTYILGSGAYGIVYKGLLDGKPIAVKTMKDHGDNTYLKSLLAELKVMIYLETHGNLIKLIGAHTSKLCKGKVYVFVDFCPLGSLEKFLRTNRATACLEEAPIYSKIGVASLQSTITIKDLYNWSIQIAQGMAYLSSRKVIHGDLAARNVLLTESRVAKITDFGLSRRLYDYAEYVRRKEERLPWRWLALESMKDLSFSTQSDIWSYGVTLWEIFSLAETPYSGAIWGIPFVTQIEHGMRLPIPRLASSELYNSVLIQCWNSNPDLRPSFPELVRLLRGMSSIILSPTTYLPNNILYTCLETQ